MNKLDHITFYNPNVNLWYIDYPACVKQDTLPQDIANYLSVLTLAGLITLAVASL